MRKYLPLFYPALDDEILAASTILAVGAKGSFALPVFQQPAEGPDVLMLEVGINQRDGEQLQELLERVQELRGKLTPEAAILKRSPLTFATAS